MFVWSESVPANGSSKGAETRALTVTESVETQLIVSDKFAYTHVMQFRSDNTRCFEGVTVLRRCS